MPGKSDNFDRSLLKGILEIPLENIGELDQEVFNKLSNIDKFLINDTLLTFASGTAKYLNEIVVAPDEKFPFAPIQTAYLFNKLKKNSTDLIINYLIRIHLQNRMLFQPDIIIHVFEHKNKWDDEMQLLVKVIRERGRWLSHQNKNWAWWNDALKPDSWSDKKSGARYLFFRNMRVFKMGESRQLLLDSWDDERADSKKLLLKIVFETFVDEDWEMISQLFFKEKGQVKFLIRQMLLMSELSEHSIALNKLFTKNKNDISGVIKSIESCKNLKELDYKKDEFSPELIYTLSFEDYINNANNLKYLENHLSIVKDSSTVINDLLINYLYRKDIRSIGLIIDKFLDGPEIIKLNNSLQYVLKNADQEFVNEIISQILQLNSPVSKWNFFMQMISNGALQLNKKNTGLFILKVRKDQKNMPLNQSILEDFMYGGCFAVYSGFAGDWKQCCEELTFSQGELNYQKVNARIRELTNFRTNFESNFPHGQ